MYKEMKLQDLMTCDIVVTRDNYLGIVIAEKEAIIYQEGDVDYYDNFTEDLLMIGDYHGGDIMAVYRNEYGGVISFYDYEDYDPIYEREDDVVWDREEYLENYRKKQEEEERKAKERAKQPKDYCMIQALYGNRTVTNLNEETVDGLILGCLSKELYEPEKFDRSIIRIPGEEELIILYNKYQEEEALEDKKKWFEKDGYVTKPLAEIPELGIKLYSRCLACRMDENGKLKGLKDEDYQKVIKYLAK